jgi:UDP-3-O-[3-hydroxymyristoyl] glucosamine N-acyltransferase
MTSFEIAALLGVEVEGDPVIEITAGAALDSAGPMDVSFAEGVKAGRSAADSRACCLIVPAGLNGLDGRTLIRVNHPRNAFARVLRELHPAARPVPGVHPTAIVAESVSLAPGVTIGPHTVIEENVALGENTVVGTGVSIGVGSSLGANCRVHARAVVYPGVTIGDRAILHAGCVIGADGFGLTFEGDHYEKFPQIGTVRIGDDFEIGANSTVDRAALGETVIGNGVKLDNMVHIGHNARIGNHVVIAAQTGVSGSAVIEDYVVVGGQVGISDKAIIESKAILGAQSGITTSQRIRSGVTVWGTPARPIKDHLRSLALVGKLQQILDGLKELRGRIERLEAK